MIKRAQEIGILGKKNHVSPDAEMEDAFEDPAFVDWLMYRISQDDMQVKEPGLGAQPTTFAELFDMSEDDIKTMVSEHNVSNPLGVGMRNFAMMNPTHSDKPGDLASPNTWGGQPALNSYGYESLPEFRRALVASAMFDPEINSQLKEFEADLEEEDEDKRSAAIRKRRAEIADDKFFRPQKALGSFRLTGKLIIESKTLIDSLE